MICNSPSLMYHYAVPFSPSSSWLHIYYTPELLKAPKVIRGARSEWGACSRTVSLGRGGVSLSYWNDTIAVGSFSGEIIIFSAITGSQIAVHSGHMDRVNSLTFSSDGTSLTSGSYDKTVKLWDVQTGGLVKTFHGHTDLVYSVSISVDCTMIASGSGDCTICIWDTKTGGCLCTIQQQWVASCVSFSPLNPGHIFAILGSKILEWDINGHQVQSAYDGSYIIFSPNHAELALSCGNDIIVQNTFSRTIIAKFHIADSTECFCFSPDGRLIAAAVGKTAYVWDITSQDPNPTDTFIGHTKYITSLVFSSPSSLVSISGDKSVKFWNISASSKDTITTNTQPTSHSPAWIESISLQARDGIAISSDSDGVVKTWDILTGVCKASFQTPAGKSNAWTKRDAKLIDNRLIFIWYKAGKMHIWETEKGQLLQTVDTTSPRCLRISGDGSKIICLFDGIIHMWSMWTWELLYEIKSGLRGVLYLESLCTYSPRIWICSRSSPAQEGWNFGTLGLPPVLFDPSSERPQLDFIGGTNWQINNPPWIKSAVTERRIFQLSGKYTRPNDIQWDGRFLVAGYDSGEILILDFHHISS